MERELGHAGMAGGGLEDAGHKVVGVEGRAFGSGEEVAVGVRRPGKLLLAEELEGMRADVDGPPAGARLSVHTLAVLGLREDGDRAAREVDVDVAEREDLAASEHRQDRDRDDPRAVLRHPRLQLLDLVPGEEARLALIRPGDPDAVDRSVDLLPALLSGL